MCSALRGKSDCSCSQVCIDKNINFGTEEIKVIIDEQNKVLKVSKKVNPKHAIGESIGIEIISSEIAKILFSELEVMMKDEQNHQEYYERAYEILIEKNPYYKSKIKENIIIIYLIFTNYFSFFF